MFQAILTTRMEQRSMSIDAIFADKAILYISAVAQAAVQSLSFFLFILCLITLQHSHEGKGITRKSKKKFLLPYICTMQAFSLALLISHLQFYRLVLVDHSSDSVYPTKPSPLHVLNNVLLILVSVWADGLMIWRCYVVWGNQIKVILAPIILVLSTIGFVIAWVSLGAQLQHSIILALIATALTIATNLLVTILIISRVLYSYHHLKHHLSRQHLEPYTSAMGIVVESAMLYSVVGVIYLITLGLGSVGEQVMGSILCGIPSIASYLVILRVNLGRAISQDAFQGEGGLSSMAFGSTHQPQPEESSSEGLTSELFDTESASHGRRSHVSIKLSNEP